MRSLYVLVVHYGEESSQRFEWRANFDYYVRDALNKTKLTFFFEILLEVALYWVNQFCWRLV
jgi:hypothetical protein